MRAEKEYQTQNPGAGDGAVPPSNWEKFLEYGALREQDQITQGFLDLVSDFNLNVKVVEKHRREFCVEGEEEDAIIIFMLQKNVTLATVYRTDW